MGSRSTVALVSIEPSPTCSPACLRLKPSAIACHMGRPSASCSSCRSSYDRAIIRSRLSGAGCAKSIAPFSIKPMSVVCSVRIVRLRL
jgi:hypothetical protein